MNTRIMGLLLAISLIAFTGCSDSLTSVNESPEAQGATAAGSFKSFSEMVASGTSIPKIATALNQETATKTTTDLGTFYFDRKAFEKAFDGRLAHEDFSGSNFPIFSFGVCPGPINQATGGYGCYPARREIKRNLIVENIDDNNDPDGLVVLTEGIIGLPTTVVGPNFFADDTRINFGIKGVNAAGFDLYDPFGGSEYGIIIFLSGETEVFTRISSGFVGFITDRSILQLTIVSSSGIGAELIDNIVYDGINTRP